MAPEADEHDHDGGCWMCAEDEKAVGDAEAALAARETALGPDHPETLAARHDLAVALNDGGWGERGRPMMAAVLADRTRVLGPDHPDTLDTRRSAVGPRWGGTDLPALEALLADYERVFGREDVRTIDLRTDVAGEYSRRPRRDWAAAARILEPALADALRGPGPDHEVTAQVRAQLANAYQALGEPARAIPLWEESLAACRRVVPRDERDVAGYRSALARAVWDAGDRPRAVALQAEATAGFEAAGEEHAIAASRQLLAQMRADGP